MDTKKIGVVEWLDKDEVACGDEDVAACLDKNNKGNFDVYFLHEHQLE